MKRRSEEVVEKRRLKMLKNEEEMKKYAVIRKANSMKKLDDAVFDKHFQNLQEPFSIQNKLYRNIDKDTVLQLYALSKENMEDMYNACDWKWNEKKELASFRSKPSRYLIINGDDHCVAAFIQMQFFVDDDDDTPVLYIYDIQVRKQYQRKGLGGRLMLCAEDIASACGIPLCRLTVFKHNPNAFEMYTKRYNYSIDPISPSQHQEKISFYDYSILVS